MKSSFHMPKGNTFCSRRPVRLHSLALGLVMMFLSPWSYSAILQYDAGPGSNLTGALDVNVPGFGLYDVEFVEVFCNSNGDCHQLTTPIAPYTFPVDNALDAELFSQALLIDVFQALSTPVEYTLEPYLTVGCEDFNECNILTPYRTIELNTFCTVLPCGTFLDTSTFTNSAISQNQINDIRHELPWDSTRSDYVFAQWSVAASTVPIPASAWLLTSGMFLLAGVIRNPEKTNAMGRP